MMLAVCVSRCYIATHFPHQVIFWSCCRYVNLLEGIKCLPYPQGWGSTVIFSYIHRLGSFLGVQNFDFFMGGGGGQKIEYFGGYDEIVYIIGESRKTGPFWGIISIHFRAFS